MSTKFKTITFNNRKKQFQCVYTSGKQVTLHFGQLGIRKNIVRAWIDKETGKCSVGFELSDGSVDFMPYDQPLALTRDPDFLLQTHIEIMTTRINEEIKRRGVSKRYLAEKLATSDNQVQRLLNPKILNKNLEQLYRIAALLGLEFEWQLKKVA